MLTRPLTRGLTRPLFSGGGGEPPLDPLADIFFGLRLQTHRGNGVPVGLYQDTACTIPATTDGDSIAAWRDEISESGAIATQSVSTKRPTLRFSGGIPEVSFDGIDDYMVLNGNYIGSSEDQTIATAFDIDSFSMYGGIITSKGAADDTSPAINTEPPGTMIVANFASPSFKRASTSISTGQYEVAAVRYGSQGDLYLNGNLAASATGISGEGAYGPNNFIGTYRCDEVNYYDGGIVSILLTGRTDVTARLSAYNQTLLPP